MLDDYSILWVFMKMCLPERSRVVRVQLQICNTSAKDSMPLLENRLSAGHKLFMKFACDLQTAAHTMAAGLMTAGAVPVFGVCC